MNRVGYNLPELGLPARMPGWAKQMTLATQAVMDAQYLHGPGGLDNFYDQADAWMQTQTARRANSSAPNSFTPEPFKMTIPRRQVVDYDADGNMRADVWAEADPNIHFPKLPALVEASPVVPTAFQMTTPPDQVMAQMMATVMAKLMAIEQRLIAALGRA